MSYSLNEVNKKGIDWEYDTNDFEFINRKDMEVGKEYNVHGVFFHNKSKFGESGVVILDNFFIDLPEHMNDGIKKMVTIQEFVDDIKAGKIKVKVYHYDTDTRKNCTGLEFIKK